MAISMVTASLLITSIWLLFIAWALPLWQ